MNGLKLLPGPIEIEGVRGFIGEDRLFLWINTREKYVEGQTVERDTCAEILLHEGERTIFFEDKIHAGYTVLQIPGDWCLEVCGGRYTLRVIGVRRPSSFEEDNFELIPCEVVDEG